MSIKWEIDKKNRNEINENKNLPNIQISFSKEKKYQIWIYECEWDDDLMTASIP